MSEHRHHGSWSVWLNDTDHVPGWGWTRLDVRPSNASHVTEEDAEWLRQVIREAARRRSPETYTPSPTELRRLLDEASPDE